VVSIEASGKPQNFHFQYWAFVRTVSAASAASDHRHSLCHFKNVVDRKAVNGAGRPQELFWICCLAHRNVQKNGHDSILPRSTMVIGCRSGPAAQPLSRVWSFGYVLGWIGGFPWLDRPDILETERTLRVGRIHFLEAKKALCSITMRFFVCFRLQSGFWYRRVLYVYPAASLKLVNDVIRQ
jgi:hypothetical protein